MNTLAHRLQKGRDQKGFTLIELVICAVVLGILSAIAIPAYGAVQERTRIAVVNDAGKEALKAFQLRMEQAGLSDQDAIFGNGGNVVNALIGELNAADAAKKGAVKTEVISYRTGEYQPQSYCAIATMRDKNDKVIARRSAGDQTCANHWVNMYPPVPSL
ncbi:Fimbrial protein precursor [Clavibacter michiganensis]|nr:Fimbrial protein precursor [Clavibacter michiganensis]